MDRLSFRDVWVSLAGARKREQHRWQHTLAICQAIFNWGGPRSKHHKPKPLDQMYRQSFSDTGRTGLGISREELRGRQDAALARVRERDVFILNRRRHVYD